MTTPLSPDLLAAYAAAIAERETAQTAYDTAWSAAYADGRTVFPADAPSVQAAEARLAQATAALAEVTARLPSASPHGRMTA